MGNEQSSQNTSQVGPRTIHVQPNSSEQTIKPTNIQYSDKIKTGSIPIVENSNLSNTGIEEHQHKKVIREKLSDYYSFNANQFHKQYANEPVLYVNSNDYIPDSHTNDLFQKQIMDRGLTIGMDRYNYSHSHNQNQYEETNSKTQSNSYNANPNIKLSLERCIGFSKIEKDIMVYYGTTLEDIDPFNLVSAREDISMAALYECYRKLRLKNHPDKNGNPDHFIAIMGAMRKMEDLYKKKEIDKDSNTLKEQFNKNDLDNTVIKDLEIANQSSDRNSFNKQFNAIFEQNRFDSGEDKGYGNQMSRGDPTDRDSITVENTLGSYNKNDFNSRFENLKKSKNTEIISYVVPEAILTDYNGLGGSAYSLVGDDTYTKDGNYTDYMQAFSETTLIDTTGFSINESKDLEKLVKDYKNSSMQLRPEQIEAIEKHDSEKQVKKHKELEYYSTMEKKIKAYDDNLKLLTNRNNS